MTDNQTPTPQPDLPPSRTPLPPSGNPQFPSRSRRWRSAVLVRTHHARMRHSHLDRLARSVLDYHHGDVEALVLRVVNRGLFLAVSVMVVLLFVLSYVTSRMPGINEIVVPLLSVPAEVDVGAIVSDTVARQRNALFDVAGLFTLVFSAIATARSLRYGLHRVAHRDPRSRPGWHDPVNLAVSAVVIAVLLVTWLLTLATVVRTRAINTILGAEISRVAIDLAKVGAVVLCIGIVASVVALTWRRMLPELPLRDRWIASLTFGSAVTAANFALLYSYIAALIDPSASGGLVLVFMTMAWVNAVARLLFLAECWLVTGRPSHAPANR